MLLMCIVGVDAGCSDHWRHAFAPAKSNNNNRRVVIFEYTDAIVLKFWIVVTNSIDSMPLYYLCQ